MRVISGIRRGQRLVSPKDMNIRPTSDRVKESLFNILGTITNDSRVLDLFAGTGSIGIEFLSRGSKFCDFVDISNNSIKIIKENISLTKFTEDSQVHRIDGLKALNLFISKEITYDYIFLDPPFNDEDLLNEILITIGENKILTEEGIVIVEHDKGINLANKILDLNKYDSRNYGSKNITFYKKF